jgi:hypothetical protein
MLYHQKSALEDRRANVFYLKDPPSQGGEATRASTPGRDGRQARKDQGGTPAQGGEGDGEASCHAGRGGGRVDLEQHRVDGWMADTPKFLRRLLHLESSGFRVSFSPFRPLASGPNDIGGGGSGM